MVEKSQLAALEQAALDVRKRAYAPYSGFAVGAAALDSEGRIHPGVNVENASLGLSICAERAAVLRAASEGARSLVAVAIATDGDELTPPCGACRQVLIEFGPDMEVILINPEGQRACYRLEELLAHPFLDYRDKSKG